LVRGWLHLFLFFEDGLEQISFSFMLIPLFLLSKPVEYIP